MTQPPVNSLPASGAALNPRLQEIADDFRSMADKDRLQLLLEFSQDLPPPAGALRRAPGPDGAGPGVPDAAVPGG